MKLVVIPHASPEQAACFSEMWRERFPDVRCAFVTAEDVQVYDVTAPRPCVVFGAKLTRTSSGWAARFGDLTASGETPEAAMRAFDVAFEGVPEAPVREAEADPAKMNAASARIQSLGCAVHIGERQVSPGVDPGLLIESPTLFRPRRVGSRPASAEKVMATDIRVTLSRAYATVIDSALGDSTLIDGVMVTSFAGPERYAEAAEWLTNLHTHLGRH